MKVRLLNVKFSQNLGDGLLCESLEDSLRALDGGLDVCSVDLAGRESYSSRAGGREFALKFLGLLPQSARSALTQAVVSIFAATRWRSHYRRGLEGAQAVVVGGGNLLTDIDLNFPTKIECALKEAKRRGLPIIVYGVGVSSEWTPRGEALFRRAFGGGQLVAAFVRDAESKRSWDARLATHVGCTATIVRDPGLLASRVWPAGREAMETPRVALGVMSYTALAYHSTTDLAPADLEAWYVACAREIVARGGRLVMFSNGSPEDTRCLRRLGADLARAGVPCEIAVPTTPVELARLMASADVVVAHRMHAIIAAYSYGVPTISLAWDSKLAAFASSVGRSNWHFRVEDVSPDFVAERAIEAAHSADALKANVEDVLDDAAAGVQRLHQALVGAA